MITIGGEKRTLINALLRDRFPSSATLYLSTDGGRW